jgi:hypothetical protein
MTKTKPLTDADLEQRFAECDVRFQENVTAVAEANSLTALDVYKLWRKYAEDCRDFDQSAIFAEFLGWYRKQLPSLPEGTPRLG